MDFDDPRRPLKLRRLQKERERIQGFLGRAPDLEDPEFEEWEAAVHSLLVEIFGANEFVLRFKQIKCRPISYGSNGYQDWYADPVQAWTAGLAHAEKVLREALEEGEMAIPQEYTPAATRDPRPSVQVVVNNQNIFSPTVHVSVEQLFVQLDAMPLSPAEQAEAKELLTELDAETKGAKRWPLIARSVEALKSLGKGVYKDIVVPLLVEFLKHEAGLAK